MERRVFGVTAFLASIAFAVPSQAGVVTSDGPDIVISTRSGFQARTADGEYAFALFGQIQFDGEDFDGFYNDGARSSGSDFEMRRLRIGVAGTARKNWHYKLNVDLTGSNAGNVDEAYIKWSGWDWAELVVGRINTPFLMDQLNSSKWVSTIERTFLKEATEAEGKQLQVQLQGQLADQFTWALALVNTANSDSDNRTRLGRGARFTWSPLHESGHALHFGAAYMDRDPGEDANATGNSSVNVADAEFGAHLASEDFDLDVNAKEDRNVGLEFAYLNGPFSLQSEWLSRHVGQVVSTGPAAVTGDIEIDGWYVQGTWTLTGEPRGYKWKDGKFDKVKPKSDTGAWELVAKFETLSVDLSDFTAESVLFAPDWEFDVWTLGVNWYVTEQVRLALNYLDLDFSGPAVSGALEAALDCLDNGAGAGACNVVGAGTGAASFPGDSGNDSDGKAIAARLQYVF